MKSFTIHTLPEDITEVFKLIMNVASLRKITDSSTPNPTSGPISSPTLSPASSPTSSIASDSTAKSGNDRSRSFISWQGERLHDIFPAGLESNSKSVKGRLYSIEPFHLYNIFLRNRGNPHVEQTIVKSAWYGKQTKSARHEFIVIHVEDLAIPGLRNCMVIDRNGGTERVQNVTAVSSSTDACDFFRVSYNGDLSQLLRESRLTPHLMLEKVQFPPEEPLLLQNLVTLVHYISEQHDKYNPLDTNCYWFTGLIWECMRRMCPSSQHSVQIPGRKGKIGFARSVPNPVQVRNVHREVQNMISALDLEDPQSSYHTPNEAHEDMDMREVHAAGPATVENV